MYAFFNSTTYIDRNWATTTSSALSQCSFPVILMFYINFTGGPKPCCPSYGVPQGVWMGLPWGNVEEYEVPVEVPVPREPGSLPAPG